MSHDRGIGDICPAMVGPHTSRWADTAQTNTASSGPIPATYESANRAVYFPILVRTTCIARRLWWTNGDTVSASYNVDAGIYLDAGYKPGTKLVSTGSTAQGTALQVQFVDITDTSLSPGLYWVAIACDTTSATFFRNQHTGAVIAASYRFQQASAMPLPASATPEENGGNALYVFGFATTASP